MNRSPRILFLRYSILLILFFVTAGLSPHTSAAQTGPRSAAGKLKIWVPAGMIGDDYWIYLNGRLRSAPPRGPDPRNQNFITVPLGNVGSGGNQVREGWEIWTAQGSVLRMRHEEYDNRLNNYINSPAGDTLHFFRAVELSLPPEKYTVEILILSRGTGPGGNYSGSSFPFVITRKYVVDVRPGQMAQIYPGVPDAWSDVRAIPAVRAYRVCPGGPVAPDVEQLQSWARGYMDDPVLQTIRGAGASTRARRKGVVVLDLPPEQGGEREFDGGQVGHMLNAVLAQHELPNHSDVADCQKRYPQFSQSYAVYDKIISDIDKDIESVRKLAADLQRDR